MSQHRLAPAIYGIAVAEEHARAQQQAAAGQPGDRGWHALAEPVSLEQFPYTGCLVQRLEALQAQDFDFPSIRAAATRWQQDVESADALPALLTGAFLTAAFIPSSDDETGGDPAHQMAHADQALMTGSLLITALFRLAWSGEPLPGYLAHLVALEIDDRSELALRRVGHVLGFGSHTHAVRHILRSQARVPELVAIALYCLLKYPEFAGDALQVAAAVHPLSACLTGGIWGAREGFSALPLPPHRLAERYPRIASVAQAMPQGDW